MQTLCVYVLTCVKMTKQPIVVQQKKKQFWQIFFKLPKVDHNNKKKHLEVSLGKVKSDKGKLALNK